MRVVYLPTVWTVIVDSVAWVVIQVGFAFLSKGFSSSLLDHTRWLYRTRPWELGGEIYDKLFRVRSWKSKLPSGGKVVGTGFSMDHIESKELEHLTRWVLETCRSELVHWLAIVPSVLFFVWNPPVAAWLNTLYALLFNLPLVIVQRHNRPRFVESIAEAGRPGA